MRLNRVVAITAIAVVATAYGQVASSVPGGPQDGLQDPVTASLRSACEFPMAGTQPVTAGITATFPVSVPAGKSVLGKDITATLVLPEPAVAALRAAGVRTVEGIASIELAVSYLGENTTGRVSLEIPAQPLPESGELLVEGPGAMDPVPTEAPGDLILALAAPRLALALRADDGDPPASIPSQPAVRSNEQDFAVVCTPEPGQDTALVTVRVARPDQASTTRPVPRTSHPDAAAGGPTTDADSPADPPGESPGESPGDAPRAPVGAVADDPPNPCGTAIPPDARQSRNGYYDVVVKTTVKKLGSDIVFGPPGYLGGKVWLWVRPNPNDPRRPFFCNGVRGDLWLPPTRGSFTTFRFVPTTAVVTVVPLGPAEGVVHPITFRFSGKAVTDMTLSDVRVSGTPLDVGPSCRTETPITIELEAEQRKFDLANGGVLEADFTIPRFAGCGVDDPLDSLFTNLVSGPGNHIRMDVSRIKECSTANPQPPVCTPAGGGR